MEGLVACKCRSSVILIPLGHAGVTTVPPCHGALHKGEEGLAVCGQPLTYQLCDLRPDAKAL